MGLSGLFALRILSFACALLLTLAGATCVVQAASPKVQLACAGDYFRYCSRFGPESQAARDCMDNHGEQLSKRCVAALVSDGEVSPKEVAERAEEAEEQ